jgi:hypothetical protein
VGKAPTLSGQKLLIEDFRSMIFSVQVEVKLDHPSKHPADYLPAHYWFTGTTGQDSTDFLTKLVTAFGYGASLM